MLSCKNIPYADKRISIKKEEIYSYLVYNIVSSGKMGGIFFLKISWRWTCSQIFRKFRRLENLRYFEWF